MRTLLFSAVMLSGALAVTGCATPAPVVAPTPPTAMGGPGTGLPDGYLTPAERPDSLALLPAPPAAGSAAQADDDAAFRELTPLQGTARGALAVQDANLNFPAAAATFACALGVPISAEQTPNLYLLLQRTVTDALLATFSAKNHYQRTRPFLVYGVSSCVPADEARLRANGSYPSGHASVGWTWGLTLAELAPERADAVLERGRAFGQSRGICGVHWKSDIEAGRTVGAATFAALHASPVFTTQMTAARAEIARERARGAAPPGDCAAEAAALATSSLIAP